jgi:hypothetical protein
VRVFCSLFKSLRFVFQVKDIAKDDETQSYFLSLFDRLFLMDSTSCLSSDNPSRSFIIELFCQALISSSFPVKKQAISILHHFFAPMPSTIDTNDLVASVTKNLSRFDQILFLLICSFGCAHLCFPVFLLPLPSH